MNGHDGNSILFRGKVDRFFTAFVGPPLQQQRDIRHGLFAIGEDGLIERLEVGDSLRALSQLIVFKDGLKALHERQAEQSRDKVAFIIGQRRSVG